MTAESSGYSGTAGKIERIYWRGEQLWVRIRSCQGLSLSVPWCQTDLPNLAPFTLPQAPLLSLQSLVELIRHLQRRGKLSTRVRKTASQP